ncbi:AI-2E family transporter [Nitratifractor sp.]
MPIDPDSSRRKEQIQLAVEIATKLGLLFIILYVSYLIVKPFLGIILWGIVLAVALAPLIDKLESKFGNRKKIIVAVMAAFVLLLVVPTWQLSGSLISSTQSMVAAVEKKEISVPAPTERVKEWPLVGEQVYAFMEKAHTDLPKALEPFHKQIKGAILWLAGLLKGALTTVLLTIASVIIAAVFLISHKSAVALYRRIMRRLVGAERGDDWARLSALTVRSVATGVVGVAVIQSLLALIGMIPMGIPLAPLWAVLIMFLTIIQMPALIVIGPMIAYVYSVSSGVPATIFAVYMLIVGASDGVLKPMLMGRGVDIPMLVILIGAIGGMMLMGMLGLFLGAVILALSYKLFEVWITEAAEGRSEADGAASPQ